MKKERKKERKKEDHGHPFVTTEALRPRSFLSDFS